MKVLQIGFVAVLGLACLATYVTSETLHPPCAKAEKVQDVV